MAVFLPGRRDQLQQQQWKQWKQWQQWPQWPQPPPQQQQPQPQQTGRPADRPTDRQAGSRPVTASAPPTEPIVWQRGQLLGSGSFGSVFFGLNTRTGKQ